MKMIFLGPQGSGKSTQAKTIAEKLSIPYLEMGQLFRDISEQDSEMGHQVKSQIDKGELVPDEIAVSLVNEKLKSEDFKKGFILDGYPRNKAQFDGLEVEVDVVYYVKVSDTEALKRLSLRGRHDDNSEAIQKRLEIYRERTEPLLSKYKEQGKLREINGEQTIEEVTSEIMEAIENEKK